MSRFLGDESDFPDYLKKNPSPGVTTSWLHVTVTSHRAARGPATKGKHMTLVGLVIFLAIGAVAGWLAGVIMKGGGFGIVGNIVVGVIGSLIGGWLFGLLGIGGGGLVGSIIAAVIGAIILLAVIGLIKRA